MSGYTALNWQYIPAHYVKSRAEEVVDEYFIRLYSLAEALHSGYSTSVIWEELKMFDVALDEMKKEYV